MKIAAAGKYSIADRRRVFDSEEDCFRGCARGRHQTWRRSGDPLRRAERAARAWRDAAGDCGYII